MFYYYLLDIDISFFAFQHNIKQKKTLLKKAYKRTNKNIQNKHEVLLFFSPPPPPPSSSCKFVYLYFFLFLSFFSFYYTVYKHDSNKYTKRIHTHTRYNEKKKLIHSEV